MRKSVTLIFCLSILLSTLAHASSWDYYIGKPMTTVQTMMGTGERANIFEKLYPMVNENSNAQSGSSFSLWYKSNNTEESLNAKFIQFWYDEKFRCNKLGIYFYSDYDSLLKKYSVDYIYRGRNNFGETFENHWLGTKYILLNTYGLDGNKCVLVIIENL